MNRPDLSDDDVLLAALSVSLDQLDRVPEAAVRLAGAAWEICHADGELAALVAGPTAGEVVVLLREEAECRALTFVASHLTVEIEIDSDRHVVGVISPPAATLIEVEMSSSQASPAVRAVQSDDLGRFQVDVGIGLCRLRVGSGPEAVVTSWFYSP
jgi:hypothetical protein